MSNSKEVSVVEVERRRGEGRRAFEEERETVARISSIALRKWDALAEFR